MGCIKINSVNGKSIGVDYKNDHSCIEHAEKGGCALDPEIGGLKGRH